MTCQLCQRCHRWWSHAAGHQERFRWITRLCPICIEAFPKAMAS
jgi:hypothetical protein